MAHDDLSFWLGSWDCAWEGGHGTNDLTRELDGHVLVERFESLAPSRFTGLSVSVPDPDGDGWRQTWVDSTGSYWHFVGGRQPDGTFVFATPEPVDAEQQFKRMVFSDIGPDALHWRWEASADGATWEERWTIDYRRRVS
jgi:hypothetical protein